MLSVRSRLSSIIVFLDFQLPNQLAVGCQIVLRVFSLFVLSPITGLPTAKMPTELFNLTLELHELILENLHAFFGSRVTSALLHGHLVGIPLRYREARSYQQTPCGLAARCHCCGHFRPGNEDACTFEARRQSTGCILSGTDNYFAVPNFLDFPWDTSGPSWN